MLLGGVAEAGVSLDAVSKRFGSFRALDGISLHLEPGRIHALVGQNGAGKSTCLGVIAGRVRASSGTVKVNGQQWPLGVTPSFARDAGVATIYQELSLVPAMSALDNVFLGATASRFGYVTQRSMRKRFDELSERLKVSINPRARVGSLSLADQQMVEVMRALSLKSEVLLLDEPTAVLAPPERASLFSVMAELREQGITLVFVSHYLDEVIANADTVTVFRDGRLIDSAAVDAWSEPQLVQAMLGEELATLEEGEWRTDALKAGSSKGAALEIEHVTTRDGSQRHIYRGQPRRDRRTWRPGGIRPFEAHSDSRRLGAWGSRPDEYGW